MPIQQRVAWIAGGAVSAGIGAAVFFGGGAVAAADAPSSASDADGADRAATARAERRSSHQEARDRRSARWRAGDVDRSMRTRATSRTAQKADAEPADAPNTAPAATASVDAPDPLTGVTRVTVFGSDPDGDELSYSATKPRFGSVTGDGEGGFTYRPKDFWRRVARFVPSIRSDGFSVEVSDGRGGVASSAVVTPFIPVNAAPVGRGTTVAAPVAQTGAVTGKVSVADPDRDRVTYQASTIDTGRGTVVIDAAGAFSYTPRAEARHDAAAVTATAADRTDSFSVTVADVFGAIARIPVRVTISPANVGPTGSVTVADPDPTSGVVTGVVAGADTDGDDLTYSGSTTTARGTVVVDPDGAITYLPNAIARRNAGSVYSTPALRSDRFVVEISDAHGGVSTVTVSVAVAPDPRSPTAVPASTFCGCTLMPADSIFHADVRGLAVRTESAWWIELLGGDRGATMRARWGGSEWMGSTAGIPVNVVAADRPKEVVIFNRGYSTAGPGIDDRPYAIPDRPLVEGMPSYPAWDRHLFVFQEGTCISQELYNVANGVELPGAGVMDILGNAVYRSIWGSTWIAEAGAQYDMSSSGYPAIGHANASRLPQVPLMLRPDEIERGYVDHMLGITIAKDAGAGYVWPARAGDGSGVDGVPMGMVFRLREDIDLSTYSESAQAVLRALQVHGAVVYDSRSPGEEGISLAAMSNGWQGTDYLDMQRELSTVPVQWFEAVDVSPLAADPAVGWRVR